MEKASGRVEKGLRPITEVKILGIFSRRCSFCRVEIGGAVRVHSKDQGKLMGDLRCGCTKLEVEMGRWIYII